MCHLCTGAATAKRRTRSGAVPQASYRHKKQRQVPAATSHRQERDPALQFFLGTHIPRIRGRPIPVIGDEKHPRLKRGLKVHCLFGGNHYYNGVVGTVRAEDFDCLFLNGDTDAISKAPAFWNVGHVSCSMEDGPTNDTMDDSAGRIKTSRRSLARTNGIGCVRKYVHAAPAHEHIERLQVLGDADLVRAEEHTGQYATRCRTRRGMQFRTKYVGGHLVIDLS